MSYYSLPVQHLDSGEDTWKERLQEGSPLDEWETARLMDYVSYAASVARQLDRRVQQLEADIASLLES